MLSCMILVIDMFDSVDSDSVYIVYIVYGVKISSKLCFRAFIDKERGGVFSRTRESRHQAFVSMYQRRDPSFRITEEIVGDLM